MFPVLDPVGYGELGAVEWMVEITHSNFDDALTTTPFMF